MLESRPLYGEDRYAEAVIVFIDQYFAKEVYDNHADAFIPAFLVNDIARFWRTLCLNYENRRVRAQEPGDKLKHRLKDMKLGFSRMLTCYSGILELASIYNSHGTVSPDDAIAMVNRTPLERLIRIAEQHPHLEGPTSTAIGHYAWFLETLGREKQAALSFLDDPGTRSVAKANQKEYHLAIVAMFKMLVADSELERFAIA